VQVAQRKERKIKQVSLFGKLPLQPFPRNSFAVSGPKKPKAFSGRKRLAKITFG